MFVCKLFEKKYCAPCFSARCDTVLDSCDVAIGYFTNHPIDIGPGDGMQDYIKYAIPGVLPA